MRFLVLYLRSRSVPLAFATLLGTTAALWWLTRLVHHPAPRVQLALLAALAGAVAIGPGLAGADRDLDRTAATAWPPRRAAHVVTGAAVVALVLAATRLTGHPLDQGGPVVRNVVGLAGLVALGAVLFGAGRAWILPAFWLLALARYAPPWGTPPTRPTYQVMLTWLVQPAGVRPATVAAVVVGAAGALAYAVLGSRR